MGLFNNSVLEQRIDRVTSDKNTTEDWSLILDICDRVKESADGPKECLKALKSKLSNDNPRVALQAITLLDACVNNCGHKFHLEVASREFEQELRKLITSIRTHRKVSEKLRLCLKSWAEGDFKSDRQLSLIPELYKKLQSEGFDFSSNSDSPKKAKSEYSTDPNVVNNKQEEDDIAQAIQLSLQTAKQQPKSGSSHGLTGGSSSLYSDLTNDLAQNFSSSLSFSDTKGAASSSSDHKKARALYDFEAVEDNELTFKAGELIVVLDDSDPNWWKGSNHFGEGLFPANFVTLDIHGEQDDVPSSRSEKRVSFSESVKVTELKEEADDVVKEEVTGEIDESKIDYLLHLLHEADPTGERPDPPNLTSIEEQVSAMAPTIDAELEQVDRKHNELSKLNSDLMSGLNIYHQLMREMPVSSVGYYPPMYGGQPPASMPPVAHQASGYPPMYMMAGGGNPAGAPPYAAMASPMPQMPPHGAMGPPTSMNGAQAPLHHHLPPQQSMASGNYEPVMSQHQPIAEPLRDQQYPVTSAGGYAMPPTEVSAAYQPSHMPMMYPGHPAAMNTPPQAHQFSSPQQQPLL